MSFFASLLAAIIPMTLYLIFIWRLDKYEREPFGKVFKHFMWGAIGAIFFGIILSLILNSTFQIFTTSEFSATFLAAVIVAPLAEEFVKAIYLFGTYHKNYFDNITDGLVYGGAIGLGFGMTENLMYFSTYDETFEQWIVVVITRSIFSAVMHAIATATVGAFLAKAKFTIGKSRFQYLLIGLGLAMLFHAIWNFSLTFEFTYYLGLIFMIFLIVSFFLIFSSSLKNERSIIQTQLVEEFDSLQIDEDVYSYLIDKCNQLDKRSQRNKLMNFASILAFRKLQAINSEGMSKIKYNEDIEDYRFRIQQILKECRS